MKRKRQRCPSYRLREEVQTKMVEAYLDEMSVKNIAHSFKCSCSTVANILKKHSIQLRGKSLPEETQLEITQAYCEGVNTNDLIISFKCCRPTVLKTLKKHSVEIRLGAPKKFSKEIEQQIADEYEKVKSSKPIAEKYKCNKMLVLKIARAYGKKISRGYPKGTVLSDARRKIPLTEYPVIIRAYTENKESAGVIAKRYEVSREFICQILRKKNIPRRTNTTPELKCQAIVQDYEQGFLLAEVAKKHSRQRCTIKRILRKRKVKIRQESLLTEEQELKIVEKYLRGENSTELASQYGCSPNTILSTVKKHGAKIRSGKGKYHHRHTKEQQKEIVKLYISGDSALNLAKKFDCCSETIHAVIRRKGITPHPKGKRKKRIPISKEKSLCNDYLDGWKIKHLVKKHGINSRKLYQILDAHGIERRTT